MTHAPFKWLAPLATVAVLGAAQLWKGTLPDAAAGVPYRAWVRQQVAEFPANAGDWRGVDVPAPRGAVASLSPGACLSRDYNDPATEERVSFLFLEVEDPRDMLGYYPPNAYPADGWELAQPAGNAVHADDAWIVGGLHIRGQAFEFRRRSIDGERRVWVRSFFVLPNNTFYPDIGSFARAAAHYNIRPYGAALVEVIFPQEYTPEDQDRIFNSMMAAHRPLLDAARFHNQH